MLFNTLYKGLHIVETHMLCQINVEFPSTILLMHGYDLILAFCAIGGTVIFLLPTSVSTRVEKRPTLILEILMSISS